VIGFVDAGVDRAAEMLKEGAIDAVVDARDPEIPVNGSPGPNLPPLIISHGRIYI
jgi:hypothetical protein